MFKIVTSLEASKYSCIAWRLLKHSGFKTLRALYVRTYSNSIACNYPCKFTLLYNVLINEKLQRKIQQWLIIGSFFFAYWIIILQDIDKLVQGSGLICRSSPPPDLMLLELPQGLLNLIQSHRAWRWGTSLRLFKYMSILSSQN